MAAREYASVADYFEHLGEKGATPKEGEDEYERILALIRAAASALEALTKTAIYDVDGDGYPLAPKVDEAFRAAACAQVEWFEENGGASGAGDLFQSGGLGSAQFTRGYSAGAGATGASARYSPVAIELLTNAGLRPT